MKREDVSTICNHFNGDRILFDYFRGRYALILLDLYLTRSMKISDLKKSPLKSLLNKSEVRDVISRCGNGIISREDLYSTWSDKNMSFRLTLDSYNGLAQTTRYGSNLVIQLNFSNKHNSAMRKLLRPQKGRKPFGYYKFHPNRQDDEHTLAWARVDLDRHSDMALIEEIQTDWIRNALWHRIRAVEIQTEFNGPKMAWNINGAICMNGEIDRYINQILKPYVSIWAEAMMASTILFLRNKLKVKDIFFHTHDSGRLLKNIAGRLPPKSLYTDIPKKFCFEETEDLPDFLKNRVRKKWKDAIRKGYRLNKLAV